MPGFAAVQDDFGIFVHGPFFRPAQRKADDDLPALLVTGSLTDKVFKFTDFRHGGDAITACMKFVAWSPDPGTSWPTNPMRRRMVRVANAVKCRPSGFCFFSVGSFYVDTMSMTMDDCPYYCSAYGADNSAACQEVGVVENGLGHEKTDGAVHSYKIGKDDPQDSNKSTCS